MSMPYVVIMPLTATFFSTPRANAFLAVDCCPPNSPSTRAARKPLLECVAEMASWEIIAVEHKPKYKG